MKNLCFARYAINIVLYVCYVLIASVIFTFLFPAVLTLVGKEVLDPSDPVFVKIQIAILLLVLIVTLIFRKHFYKSAPMKKTIKKTTPKKVKKEKEEDGKMKIYIEKEIK